MSQEEIVELISGVEFTQQWWATRDSPEKAEFFGDIAKALRELLAVKSDGVR